MHIIILGSSTNMPNIKDSSNSIISTVKLVVLGSGGVGKSAIVSKIHSFHINKKFLGNAIRSRNIH